MACVATVLLATASPASASAPALSGTPAIAGDPYQNRCAIDSYGVNTTTIADGGHLHMVDPGSGNEIGDAYFFYTPSCHGFFLTTLSRANHFYLHPSLWPRGMSAPVDGLSSLYVGNGLAWTYVLGGMTGHAACARIDVTTPQGAAVTTVDLGCTAVF